MPNNEKTRIPLFTVDIAGEETLAIKLHGAMNAQLELEGGKIPFEELAILLIPAAMVLSGGDKDNAKKALLLAAAEGLGEMVSMSEDTDG